MTPRLFKAALVCVLLASLAVAQSVAPLKVLTLNVWSGLDYAGTTSVGEYESPIDRERRIEALISLLKSLGPDVIALQEVNPSSRLAARIADSLDHTYIAQRILGGIKLGQFGIPYNLNEGGAILARRALELEFVDVVPLSGSWGLFGNTISFHVDEQNAALVGRLRIDDRWLYVASVHLPAEPPNSQENRDRLREIVLRRGGTEEDVAESLEELRSQSVRRGEMVDELCGRLQSLTGGAPLILLGDLNAEPGSDDVVPLLTHGFTDAAASLGNAPTWDPSNPLIRLQMSRVPSTAMEELAAWYDTRPRRIDHIHLNASYPASSVREAEIVGRTAPVSDHYGLLARLDPPPPVELPTPESFEFLPILSYDTDVGFGYGIKAFWLNPLGHRESFDVVLFNSTKGERWYRMVFSVPDFELRQGTTYPWALDVVLDYDKYLKNSFFGTGGGTRFEDRQTYTREPFEITGVLSTAPTPRIIASASLRYKTVRNFNLPDSGLMALLDPISRGRADALSVGLAFGYDSRNSYIDPSLGWVIRGEVEFAPAVLGTNTHFRRYGGTLQYYTPIVYPKTVLAARLIVQDLEGGQLPIQFLIPTGGNASLRGSPQDRYLLYGSFVANLELRFPIVWRFGGVLGWDAGVSDPGVSQPSGMHPSSGFFSSPRSRWVTNAVVGLRFFMDTFIVRADLGFGDETTGFYLNFGHLF